MKTISERIFDKTLDGVPEDIVLDIGEDIEYLMQEEQKFLEAAIFIATARAVKKYSGEPSPTERGTWFDTCIGIGDEVYSMCIKRYPDENMEIIRRQAVAGAYRGTIDKTIEKLASIKAKNFAIDE